MKMMNTKLLVLLGIFLFLGVGLCIPWVYAWTDPVIEGKVLWAFQAPRNESGTKNLFVEGFKVVVDDENNSYVCGFMSGGKVSFGDITVYTQPATLSGFVLGLYPNGTEKFVITINATGNVFCYGLALVSDGFYISGSFSGNFTGDFASQFPASELKDVSDVSGITARGFFVKYHPDGTVFDYSLNVLGSEDHFAEIIALSSDGEDNLYLVGNFNGDITVGSETLESSTDSSAFFAKYFDRTFLDAQVFGGNGSTFVYGVATNSEGYSCIIGTTSDTTTIGNVTFNSAPFRSVYLHQLSPDGTQIWFDSMTTIDSVSFGVQIDERRACSFSGFFQSFLQRSNNERVDVAGAGSFFTKYRPDGNNVVFETTRGDVFDYFSDLSCSDPTGSCYISGFYQGNLTIQGVTYSNDGSDQYFVAKYDNDGNFLGLINGTGVSIGISLAFKNDNLWVTGIFLQSLILDDIELFSIASTTMFTARYT